MPSLRAAQLPAIEEEPDTSVEAVVVAASLRRLAENVGVDAPREWL